MGEPLRGALRVRVLVLVQSLRLEPVAVTMPGSKCLCSAWTTSRRMGRLPRACVFGCLDSDSIVHYLQCPVVRDAVTEACGPILPLFGRMAEGMAPPWRHVAVAAELCCVTSHARSADVIAAMVLAADGPRRIRTAACRVAKTAADLLPGRRRGMLR